MKTKLLTIGISVLLFNFPMHAQKVYIGEYVDNIKEGLWIENGDTGEYISGKRHGYWKTQYSPEGSKSSYALNGFYRMGKPVGVWETHDPLDNPIQKCHFQNGREVKFNQYGLSIFRDKNWKYGLIDTNLNVIIPAIYEYLFFSPVEECKYFKAVRYPNDSTVIHSFISDKGEIVIDNWPFHYVEYRPGLNIALVKETAWDHYQIFRFQDSSFSKTNFDDLEMDFERNYPNPVFLVGISNSHSMPNLTIAFYYILFPVTICLVIIDALPEIDEYWVWHIKRRLKFLDTNGEIVARSGSRKFKEILEKYYNGEIPVI